jgi:hypothetical protein
MAATMVQTSTVAIARAPGKGANHWRKAAYKSSAIPDLSRTLAMKMNKGRATRGKLIIPLKTWMTVKLSIPVPPYITATITEQTAKVKAMGKPKSRQPKRQASINPR